MKKEQNQHSEQPTLEEKLTSRIFVILRADYGRGFTARFTTENALEVAKKRWGSVLCKLSSEQIKHGIDRMGREFKRFPPTVYEFRELCEDIQPAQQKSHQLYIEKNVKVAEKHIGASCLDEIRGALK